jgi:hypothetical protein
MDHSQQLGLFIRLQRDLVNAYTSPICEAGLIERLTAELGHLRGLLSKVKDLDEQTGESLPGVLSIELALARK